MADAAFQRARRPEQKRQRRAEILAAAAELFARDGAAGVSLNRVARRAGLAKSNLYRYFNSLEQILTWLLLDRMEGWADEVEARLEPLAGRSSPAAVARVLTMTLIARPRLSELASLWAAVSGHGACDRTGSGLERVAGKLEDRLVSALSRALPAMPAGSSRLVLRAVLALTAGLAALRDGGRAEGLPEPEPGGVWPEFEVDLECSIRALLYGMLVEGWRASGRQAVSP